MERFQNTRQPDWDWWGKLWPTPGATLRRLGLSADSVLAEVGCGNGYFTLPAARITDPTPVYALDLDETLLDELAHLAEQQGLENVVPQHGDARNLVEHLPEPVDVVLIANTFHGVTDAANVVGQVFDSLRDGGQLVVVNWQDAPPEATPVGGQPRGPPADLRLSPAQTEAAVTETSGFTLDESVTLPPHHYALVFEH